MSENKPASNSELLIQQRREEVRYDTNQWLEVLKEDQEGEEVSCHPSMPHKDDLMKMGEGTKFCLMVNGVPKSYTTRLITKYGYAYAHEKSVRNPILERIVIAAVFLFIIRLWTSK